MKERYFKTSYTPVGVSLNVNAMIHFKNKLQLEFRNNKNCSNAIVIFYTGLRKRKKNKIKIQEERKLPLVVDSSLVHCHFSVATVT